MGDGEVFAGAGVCDGVGVGDEEGDAVGEEVTEGGELGAELNLSGAELGLLGAVADGEVETSELALAIPKPVSAMTRASAAAPALCLAFGLFRLNKAMAARTIITLDPIPPRAE